MSTSQWTARRKASMALFAFAILVFTIAAALMLWTQELYLQYSSRLSADFAGVAFFCIILIIASVWLSKGKPIFGS